VAARRPTPVTGVVAMVEALLALATPGLLVMAAVLGLRRVEQRRWQAEAVCYRLRFPGDVSPEAVVACLAGLAGLAAPRWRRVTACRAVVFEVTASTTGIEHHVVTARSQAPILVSQLRAALPRVVVTEDAEHRPLRPTLAGELRLRGDDRPLRVERPEAVSTALLSSLGPVEAGEQVVMQWVLAPLGPVPAVVSPARRGQGLLGLVDDSGSRPDAGDRRAAQAKRATPLFAAAVRLGVRAASPARAWLLLGRLSAACHGANAAGAHLARRPLPSWWTARCLARRAVPVLVWPCLLNAGELAALVAFPLEGPLVAGLHLGTTPQLPPSAEIPSRGRRLARSTFPGAERDLAVSVEDSLKGMLVTGPPGTGKTTLFLNLLAGDVAAGRGVVGMAPKHLVQASLDLVGPARQPDVILIDPAGDERLPGINPIAGTGDPYQATASVVDTFAHLFPYWGPQVADVTRTAVLTLALAGDMSLVELPAVLTDRAFRRRLLARIDDPVLLDTWRSYEARSDADWSQAIAPTLSRARSWLAHRSLRAILGQVPPTVDFDDVLVQGRILLVSLNSGVLGAEVASLLGSLVFAGLWAAVERRAALPPSACPPVMVFLDEWQRFAGVVKADFGAAVAMARGLGVGLHCANQNLAQLPAELRESAIANLRSKVVFSPAASDAHRLAQEFAPLLSAADLQGLGQHEAAIAVAVGARVSPATIGRTLGPPPPLGRAATVRAASRRRWGRDRTEVEAAMAARLGQRDGAGPVGRGRRVS
jgi:hypothetical protein